MKNILIQLKYEFFCLVFVDGTWEDAFHAKHNTSVECRYEFAAPFYCLWFSGGCQIGCEPAYSIEEARTIVSHWVPNIEPGDRIEVEETN